MANLTHMHCWPGLQLQALCRQKMTIHRGLTREEILKLLDLDESDSRDDDPTFSDSKNCESNDDDFADENNVSRGVCYAIKFHFLGLACKKCFNY